MKYQITLNVYRDMPNKLTQQTLLTVTMTYNTVDLCCYSFNLSIVCVPRR